MTRAHLLISGRVQGVFFRANTQRKAQELGLRGWVKNTRDGRVEVIAEGEKEKIKKLIDWAHQGPDIARVNKVEVEWEDYEGEFDSFEIKY